MDLSEASEVKTHRLQRSRIREIGKKSLSYVVASWGW